MMPRVKPDLSPIKTMYGTTVMANVWYADIRAQESESRRIRIIALSKDRAYRQAKEFCAPGEHLVQLLDHTKAVVWTCTPESIKQQMKAHKRAKY